VQCCVITGIHFSFIITKQKSLADARQQCVYEGPLRRNLRRINARNVMLKSTFSGLQLTTVAIFIRSAVFAAKICKIPRNSPKIRTYRIAVKVIQGYRSWCLLIG